MAHHPVGKRRHALRVGHQQEDHGGQLCLAHSRRLDTGRLQKITEYIHSRTLYRVGDQCLVGQVAGQDVPALCQRVAGGQYQSALIGEQGQECQLRGGDWIRGDDQVDISLAQRRQ